MTLDLTTLCPEVSLPLVVLTVAALIALLGSVFYRRRGIEIAWGASVAGLIVCAASLVAFWARPGRPGVLGFGGALVMDNFALFAGAIFLLGAFFAVLMSGEYVRAHPRLSGEYYALMLLSTVGMMAMAMAQDLIVAFIALEVLSIPLYVLAGFSGADARGNEASVKYLVLGGLASGFMLFGIGLLYGAFGTTVVSDVALAVRGGWEAPFAVGVGLLIVGLGFKAGLVPFHMWVPDVYQGAPTPVTAFMAVGPKAAAFALLFRLFGHTFHFAPQTWGVALWIIAALTMTCGNLVALRQTELKRLLAYSSIAHAGTVVLAILASRHQQLLAAEAMLYYLLAYGLMKAGAFAVVVVLQPGHEGDLKIASLRGLSARRPALAAAMAIFMFSLAGVPPMAGFVAKLWVLQQAVSAGYIGLAIIAVLNAVVAAYYYARVVVAMYMEPEEEAPEAVPSRPGAIAATAIAALATVLLGVAPGAIILLARSAAQMLL